jgi:cellulose biosynthesis protein BcsQ
MDPQADVTYALLGQRAPEARNGYLPPTTHALLTGHYTIEQVTLEVPRYKSLYLIPSNGDLADAALKLSQRPTCLRRLLDGLPPDAFDVIVMVAPGKLELDAIARIREHVALVRDEVLLQAKEPNIRGILLTLADPYSITQDTIKRIKNQYPGLLLKTTIPKNNDLQKAIGRARSIFEIAPSSKGAQAYWDLIEELIP